MKKLITLSFLFFFLLVGNAQVTGVTVVDISDAVKVADFPGIFNGTIEKHNDEYFSLTRGGNYGYRRKDTLGSKWEFVDFPDSIIIRETFFIDGKWIGFEHHYEPCRNDDMGLPSCFLYTLNLYHFDFDSGSLVPIHSFKNCGSISAPTIAKTGEYLFVSFPSYCLSNYQIHKKVNYYSSNGENWFLFYSNDFFPQSKVGQKYVSFDLENNVAFLSDTFAFAQNNKLYLPDTVDLLSIYEFQDSIYLFSTYKDYFYKTGDLGATWETIPLPYKLIRVPQYQEGYVFCNGLSNDGFRDAMAYSLKDNSFYSIIPDSLSSTFYNYSVTITDKEIIGNFSQKGGLFRSFDKGKTWESYMAGVPRIGLSQIEKFDGIVYGEGGRWISADGENWSKFRYKNKIPFAFKAYNNYAVLAAQDLKSPESFLLKKEKDTNWAVCDTIRYSNSIFFPNSHLFSEKITYTEGGDELKSGTKNCSDWKSFSKEGAILSLSDYDFVSNGDSILSVGYEWPNYSLLRSFDFGNTWTTLNYIPKFSDDFLILNNSIVRTNYRNGEIWISNDWGETWEQTAKYFPAFANSIFTKPNKEFLTIYTDRFYLISSNFGRNWIALDDENILDFEFLQDSTMLISKNDGVYKMDGRTILDSLDSFKNQVVSSISETQLDSKINAYPNPVSDILTIKIEDIDSELLEVNLLNQLGQIISKHRSNSFSKTHQIETSKVPKGMFFVDMKFSDGRHSIKKVIKN